MQTDTGSRFPWRALLLLLAAAGAAYAASLGTRDLWAPDEPKYALVAREMLEGGSWFVPHVNGRPYPDKPPLLFWTIALASRLTGGVGQPAAVLPSILAALVVLGCTAGLAWVLPGGRSRAAPLAAAGLLAVSWRFAMQATVGQIDMLLTAGTTAAFLLLARGVGLAADREPRRGAAILAWGVMGLAVLAKGPVGVILPVGGLLTGMFLAGRRVPVRRFFPAAGLALFVVVIGAWLVPAGLTALAAGNESWLTDLLFRQTAVRYVSSWHHFRPPWYLLVVPLYDFQPLLLLAVPALLALPREYRVARTGPADRRATARALLLLAGAVLFILVFFSIPRGKRAVYILPAMPLVAALSGIDLGRRLEAREARALRGPRLAAGATALLLALVAGGLLVAAPGALARRGIEVDVRLPAVLLVLAAGCLLVAALARRPGRWLAAALAAGFLFWGVSFRVVFPALDQRNSAGRFVAAVRERLLPGTPGGMVDFRAQFGFHAGRLLEAEPGRDADLDRLAVRLAGDAPFWVIVRERHLSRLLERIPADRRPVEVLRRPVGNSVFVALANRAALRGEHGPGGGSR